MFERSPHPQRPGQARAEHAAAQPGKATQQERHAAAPRENRAAARIQALIDAAAKPDAERLVFALEDAVARAASTDTLYLVQLPRQNTDEHVPGDAIAALIASARAKAGLAGAGKPAGAEIAPSEVLFEQMSHKFTASMTPDEEVWLREQGFTASPRKVGQCGLDYRLFTPIGTRAGAPSVLAFKGTDNDDIRGDMTDNLLEQGIGARQIAFNEALLVQELQTLRATAPVVLIGHSLGGALAQTFGAMYPEAIDGIHTYQSPGVNKETAERIRKYNQSHPAGAQVRSSHHRMSHDPVSKGGEAWTDGTVYTYVARDEKNILDGGGEQAHDTMMATRIWQAKHAAAQDDGLYLGVESDPALLYQSAASYEKPGMVESGRDTAGGLGIDAMQGDLFYTKHMRNYLPLWHRLRDQLKANTPLTVLMPQIDRADLPDNLEWKGRMRRELWDLAKLLDRGGWQAVPQPPGPPSQGAD